MYIQWKKEWTSPAVVGLVSFAAGVGTGYLIYRRKIDNEVNEAVDVMNTLNKATKTFVESTKHFRFDIPEAKKLEILDEPVKHNDYMNPQGIIDRNKAREFTEAVQTNVIGGNVDIPDPPDVRNIFDQNWDQEAEEATRGPDHPYVIHIDEYFDRGNGYVQGSLEYYEGDNILSDENNVPIYAPEKVVGRLEWGRGSREPNVVYIRNDSLRAEYEVTRNPGSFQMEVLGLEADAEAEQDELKHSNAVRRFRPDRD